MVITHIYHRTVKVEKPFPADIDQKNQTGPLVVNDITAGVRLFR